MIPPASLEFDGNDSRPTGGDRRDRIPPRANPVPPAILLIEPETPGALPFYLYLPPGVRQGERPMVSVHGISRNALEHAEALRPVAAAQARPLIAPLFSRTEHPRYQRLARDGHRADRALLATLADLETRLGTAVERIDLFGFSGGSQFGHRFAMLHPQRVGRLVLAAAGWYTFPVMEDAYPYGLGGRSDMGAAMATSLDRFLEIPTLVLVGERDKKRDESLRQKAIVDKRQGLDRIERGQSWTAAIAATATARGLVPRVAMETLPLCGHGFATCVRRGGMPERVGRWFGSPD